MKFVFILCERKEKWFKVSLVTSTFESKGRVTQGTRGSILHKFDIMRGLMCRDMVLPTIGYCQPKGQFKNDTNFNHCQDEGPACNGGKVVRRAGKLSVVVLPGCLDGKCMTGY